MSSECSSGCQSGWTIYLVHSSDEQSSLSHKLGAGCFRPEEEDLSMVSDASSWPPHFDGAGYCCVFSAPVPTDDGGEKGGAAGEQQPQIQHAVLEDTASSQLCSNTNKSKRPMEELLDSSSCDLSTTQSKAKPTSTTPRQGSRKQRRKEYEVAE